MSILQSIHHWQLRSWPAGIPGLLGAGIANASNLGLIFLIKRETPSKAEPPLLLESISLPPAYLCIIRVAPTYPLL